MDADERAKATQAWREWMSREFTPEERMTIRMRLSLYSPVPSPKSDDSGSDRG